MSSSLVTKEISEDIPVKRASSPKTLIIVAIVLLIVTALLQFPQYWLINIDASVFWYEGQQILKGKIPYRDIWDHKPPLIYYFNALCLLILPAKAEFLRIISVLLSFGTSFFLFVTLRRFFQNVALITIVVLLFTFYLNDSIVDRGLFYTENLQIFLISVAFFFFTKWYQTAKNADLALMGFFCSLALLSKQTELGLVIIVLFLISLSYFKANKTEKWQVLKQFGCFLIPLLLPAVCFAVYFWLNNAWNDFFDQNITYNRVYISTISVLSNLFKNLHAFFFELNSIAILTTLGIFLFILKLVNRNSRRKFWQAEKLFCLATAWFLIDFITIDLSGRNYSHYYLQLLIPCSILTFYFLKNASLFCQKVLKVDTKAKRALVITAVGAISLILFLELNTFALADEVTRFGAGVQNFGKPLTEIDVDGTDAVLDAVGEDVTNYIYSEDRSINHQSIYVWGRGAEVFFYVGVSSPTKFIYNLPLLTTGYSTVAMRNQFMQDLEKNPPAYFIDTGFPDYIFPTQIDPDTVDKFSSADALNYPIDPAFRQQLQDFLTKNYVLDKAFNQGNYTQMTLYRLKNNN